MPDSQADAASTRPQQAPAGWQAAHADPALITALRAQHVCMVFQPQYTLPPLQLRGFEALARLCVGGQHWVAPERFLPLAHAAGLMGALTLHMVEAACRALRNWRETGRAPVFVAVNIEPDDLADVLFAPRVCRLLADYRVRPGELELELVERRSQSSGHTMQANISQLRRAGIRLAMDDFGTGESALAQLGELPFDIIKIDKSFLARVPAEAGASTLLRHVVALCAALGKEVVVEGVETDAQLQWLHRLYPVPPQWLRVQGNALSFPLSEALAAECIPFIAGPGRRRSPPQ